METYTTIQIPVNNLTIFIAFYLLSCLVISFLASKGKMDLISYFLIFLISPLIFLVSRIYKFLQLVGVWFFIDWYFDKNMKDFNEEEKNVFKNRYENMLKYWYFRNCLKPFVKRVVNKRYPNLIS